jgi:hypothetical protein
MKTREVVKALRDFDPTGNTPVTIRTLDEEGAIEERSIYMIEHLRDRLVIYPGRKTRRKVGMVRRKGT